MWYNTHDTEWQYGVCDCLVSINLFKYFCYTGNGSGDASNGEVTESKPVGEDITSSNGAATPAKGKGKGNCFNLQI